MSEPEFVEIAEDGPGSVEWLDDDLEEDPEEEPETLRSHGSPLRLRFTGFTGFNRRRLRIAALATAVAAVLAATTVILHVNHEFGPWPNPRSTAVGSVDWQKTLPGTGVGMWTTSDSVVIATQDGLTAYSISHGQRLWSWDPPTGDGLCAMSPTTSQGLGVVAYGATSGPDAGATVQVVVIGSGSGSTVPELNCTDAQAIDVGTGKAAWAQPVDLTQGQSPIFSSTTANELSISAGFVVAPYGQNGLISLNAATGARLWASSQLDGAGVSSADACYEGAQTLDGDVYALMGDAGSTCNGGAGGVDISEPEVAVYKAATVSSPQVLQLPDTDSPRCPAQDRTILSTAADVLLTCLNYYGQSYPAYAVPAGTAQLVPLALQRTGGITAADVAPGAGQLGLTDGFASGGDLLVDSIHTSASTTALTGFDINTGTPLWRYAVPAGTQFYPLGSGGGGIGSGSGEVEGVAISGKSWTLLSLDPKSGAASPTVPLNSAALSGSGVNGSFDVAVVGSKAVVGELGTNTTIVVSTL